MIWFVVKVLSNHVPPHAGWLFLPVVNALCHILVNKKNKTMKDKKMVLTRSRSNRNRVLFCLLNLGNLAEGHIAWVSDPAGNSLH